MKKYLFHILFFVLYNCNITIAQTPVDTIPPVETLDLPMIDELEKEFSKQDSTSTPTSTSTGIPEGVLPTPQPQTTTVKISKDAPDAPILYTAEDSMRFDIKNNQLYLYGNAKVTQQTINLTADFIIIDWANNVVTAEGTKDSLGRTTGRPDFKDGEDGFTSRKMQYNFNTKKGKVFDAITQENDLYIHGEDSKILQDAYYDDKDSSYHDVIYNQDAIFTTCNHEHPHFGIHAKKLKMIPDKIAVVGRSNLEIGGVPVPLGLPFGFFPLSQGERTGLIFPRDIEYTPEWGFGLKEVGWYFPINDNWDTKVTGDIYFAGTWGLRVNSRYKYRYRNNGNFTLAYSNRIVEQADASITPERSISLRWSHAQDGSAHPSRRFSSSVNIQTNGFQSRNYNDAESVLSNSLSSNINFSKSFPGKPFTFSASMNHSQNTRTNLVTFNLPTVNFNMNRIYPFKQKNRTGKEKWFEKITLKYDASAQNRFTTTDTTLFTRETLESAQYGIKHNASSDVSFKVFKFINISPGISYNEVWYGNEISRDWDPTPTIETREFFNPDGSLAGTESDTTSYGELIDNKINGFSRYFQFNASVSANTTLYATKLWDKGWLRGFRHVMRPNVSLVYTPDYTNPSFGWYKEAISQVTPLNTEADTMLYSIFEGGVYGSPSRGGKQMALSYGINNNFEAKYFSNRDSTEKKIKLMETIRINGNYNFAADSLKFSPVNLSATSRFFKGLTTLNISASWDPYAVVVDGKRFKRVDEFYLNTNKKPLRFDNAQIRTNTGLTIKQIRGFFKKDKDENEESADEADELEEDRLGEFNTDRDSRQAQSDAILGNTGPNGPRGDKPSAIRIDILDMFDNFRIQHNFSMRVQQSVATGNDTLTVDNHTIEIRGNIDLTEKWKITVGRIGYNFTQKRVTFPDLSFYRNLHCWEMGMSWRPDRGSYSFFLRVKPSSLDFIELPYKKNPVDGRF